jgi:hypothetical protein
MTRRAKRRKTRAADPERFWLKSDSPLWSETLLEILNLYEFARVTSVADWDSDHSDALILARRLRATALHDREIHLPSLERLKAWSES